MDYRRESYLSGVGSTALNTVDVWVSGDEPYAEGLWIVFVDYSATLYMEIH